MVWFCTTTNVLLSNVKEKLEFPKIVSHEISQFWNQICEAIFFFLKFHLASESIYFRYLGAETMSNFEISDKVKFWLGTNTTYSSLWQKCCVSKCWPQIAEKQALVYFCSWVLLLYISGSWRSSWHGACSGSVLFCGLPPSYSDVQT